MKYRKELYLMLAHINPALYDVIFPQGPLNIGAPQQVRMYSHEHQTQGSIFGTDYSGELTVLARLSWKMKHLIESLRTVIIQSKAFSEQGNKTKGMQSFVSALIDEYCGNGIRVPFPPRPKGFETMSVHEKVAAATVFAHAATAMQGTELETIFGEGADKVLDSAISGFEVRAAK